MSPVRDGIASQHRRLEVLLDQLAAAMQHAAGVEWETSVFQLEGALHSHFDVEELVVFPSLRATDPALSKEIDRLEEDHHALREHLHTLTLTVVGADAEAAAAALEALRAALARHEALEEEILARSERGPGGG